MSEKEIEGLREEMTHVSPPGPFQQHPLCSPMFRPCPWLRPPPLIHFLSCKEHAALLTKAVCLRTSKDVHCLRTICSLCAKGLHRELGVLVWRATPACLSSSLACTSHSGLLAIVPLPCPIQVQGHALVPPVICPRYLLGSEDLPAPQPCSM